MRRAALVVPVALFAVMLVGGSVLAATINCPGVVDCLGTKKKDTLLGTDGFDRLRGLRGNDTLRGWAPSMC